MLLGTARALGRAALVLTAVSVLVFLATAALPVDPARARTGGRGDVTALRAELGLDRPPWTRFAGWAGDLLRGDPGVSLVSGRPVTDLLAARLPATLALVAAAALVALPLLLAGGWAAGRRPRTAAPPLVAVAAVPQVVVATGLVAVFAGVLGWFPAVSFVPVSGSVWDRPEALVLPALALGVPAAAFGAGLLGGAVADALALPHVRAARVRGLPEPVVLLRHVLPDLGAPLLRVSGLVVAGMTASSALVETVFGYAGLGELLVGAVSTGDVPVVQAIALLSAVVVVVTSTAADLPAGTPLGRTPLGSTRSGSTR
ncbi:ABC transporter permease [Saccharothrix longispora]|uniref:Peptide/nickel transport system permease protein n=1 Tax=Saccharothrix longispora TaxID=33920 RepID=A0ABU1PS02_9PSEU|nr:ABC transporter permease [Saccharothrix longispora]MDR6593422.1 peptide/nickel transport system permease protein [Saccharothrix longispora]